MQVASALANRSSSYGTKTTTKVFMPSFVRVVVVRPHPGGRVPGKSWSWPTALASRGESHQRASPHRKTSPDRVALAPQEVVRTLAMPKSSGLSQAAIYAHGARQRARARA
eukprot:scaffold251780_cov31-Tisochrysis_lutea.AAC.4